MRESHVMCEIEVHRIHTSNSFMLDASFVLALPGRSEGDAAGQKLRREFRNVSTYLKHHDVETKKA